MNGKVLIGNAGSEYGVRGYVSAYDAGSGELLWRFHTVPGDPSQGFENAAMERAAKTWKGRWWEMGGGGTVWETIAYDPKLDLVYIGTGNGVPWTRKLRSPGGGDNLYIASIVALKADTGEYAWHYQTTPGEVWDYDATAQLMLADLAVESAGGPARPVIMQANKNGFFYVLDRATGQLLSAKAYTTVNWASGIDLKSGRPIENPDARYDERGTTFNAMPGRGRRSFLALDVIQPEDRPGLHPGAGHGHVVHGAAAGCRQPLQVQHRLRLRDRLTAAGPEDQGRRKGDDRRAGCWHGTR